MGGERALLVVALVAPALGAGAAAGTVSLRLGRSILQAAALVCAAAWAGLVAASSTVAVGGFHSGTLVAPAACGAALLLSSAHRDAVSRASAVLAGIGLAALNGGLAAGGGGGDALGLMVGLVAGGGCLVVASWEPDRVAGFLAPPLAAVGAGGTGLGLMLAHGDTTSWTLPALGTTTISEEAVVALLVGGAAFCVAGGLRPGRGASVLMAGGLAIVLRAGPLIVSPRSVIAGPGAADGLAGAVLAFLILAMAAALLRRAPLALALVAVAMAAGPPSMVPGSRLLAAAAVLALAVDRVPAWLLAAPGAAAVVYGALESGTDVSLTCAAGLGAVAAAIVAVAVFDRGKASPRPLEPFSSGAAIAGAWLVLAPGSMTWAGAQFLRFYDVGAARACAAALIAGVLAVAVTFRPDGWPRRRRPVARRATSEPEPAEPELVRSG